MISFRYHVVSLIGVFLALALGIVVGTTALNGPITTDLRHQVDALKNDRASLADQLKTAQGQLGDSQKFAAEYGPAIVNNALKDKNVILLGMPGADDGTKDALAKEIGVAGGKVTGRVQLTGDYVDPKRAGDLTSLAVNVHPLGLTLPQTNDAGAVAGSLLAYVLLGKGQQSDLRQVLSGLAELHMLKVESSDVAPATTVLVVGGGSEPTGDAGAKTQLATVTELENAGGHVVVAGDAASANGGGLIALVRTDEVDKGSVSTVDDADTAMGQVSTVLALAQVDKRVGHYGTGNNSDALFPEPNK